MSDAEYDQFTPLLRRGPVLEACQDGPVGRSVIAERADCSRTTAYRATDALEDRGLVERQSGGYALTGAGRATLERLRQFRTGMAGIERLAPLLSLVDAPELVEHAHLLTDATVVENYPERPYNVEQHVTALIEDTDEAIVGLSSSFGSPTTLSRTFERVEAGVTCEWTFPRAVFDRLEAQHDELTESAFAHDNTALYVVDDVPLDLAVYDDTLVVVAFDDDRGVFGAVATTDDPDAVAWGRRVVEERRADGERVA